MANDSIDTLAKKLGDAAAPWVNRRDAVDGLVDAVERARAALNAHAGDKDVDVQMAVRRALERLAGSAPTVFAAPPPAPAPPPPEEPPTLKELVEACAKPGERDIEPDGEAFVVRVTHKSGRKQTVRIEAIDREDGLRIVRVFSPCGAAKDTFHAWCLKANTRLVQSAIGLADVGGVENFCLLRTFLEGQITKPEMHAAIKEIAYYADWIEHKMTGQDEL